MAADSFDDAALGQLKHRNQEKLMDLIDKLRAQGINQHVGLPQLIVCGDQSSGKSSVLEAISRVHFPTGNLACTLFATELILRKAHEPRVEVSIIPGPSRSAKDKQRLLGFRPDFKTPDDLPKVIEDAKRVMETSGDEKAATFCDDVLRVDISGPNHPHLTLVDLPGLIHAVNRHQKEEDIDLIRRLVRKYMGDDRSIILAVVSAQNDYANQIVTKLAKEFDPQGRRTLGIITKPDVARPSEQESFVTLARNEDVIFHLGWHVLKNRDHDKRHTSFAERDEAEKQFFSQGVWRDLPLTSVGIESLRKKLSDILLKQINTVLPHLLKDIEDGIADCQRRLKKFGTPRSTLKEKRSYLVAISQVFENLVRRGIDGSYQDQFFDDSAQPKLEERYIRAKVQKLNDNFAAKMRHSGHRWNILPDEIRASESGPNGAGGETGNLQQGIRRSEFIESIKQVSDIKRGTELPGMPNSQRVGDLFRTQAEPWEGITQSHIETVWRSALVFLQLALRTVTNEDTFELVLNEIIYPAMDSRLDKLNKKMEELLTPHRHFHPITCDKAFVQAWKRPLAGVDAPQPFPAFISGAPQNGFPMKGQTDSVFAKRISIEEANAMDILNCMEAYYKIALRTYIDNVASLAIELCLMYGLSDIFSPSIVSNMDDELIELVAAEGEDIVRERDMLQAKLNEFEAALHSCQRFGGQLSTLTCLLDQVVEFSLMINPEALRPRSNRSRISISENGPLTSTFKHPFHGLTAQGATQNEGIAEPAESVFGTPIHQPPKDPMGDISTRLRSLSIGEPTQDQSAGPESPQSSATPSLSSVSTPSIFVNSPRTPESSLHAGNPNTTSSKTSPRHGRSQRDMGQSLFGSKLTGSPAGVDAASKSTDDLLFRFSKSKA